MPTAGCHTRCRTLSSARGFSLVELMIAITIGLFIVAGVISILLSIRQTYAVQDNLTQMQDSQRLAHAILSSAVHDAGYFVEPTLNTVQTALPAVTGSTPDGAAFAAGQIVSGTGNAASAGDTLNLRYQTADKDELPDCLGNTNTSGAAAVYTNSFAINGASQLTCAVGINGAPPVGAAVPIVDNVASMQVEYGVDTDADGSVDTYLSAAAVSAGNYWLAVGSVRLHLVFVDLLNPPPAVSVNPQVWHTIHLMNRPVTTL